MYKRWRRAVAAFLVIVCMMTLAGVNGVYAAENDGQESRTVRIGYIDYSGFITLEDDGDYVGYGVEYLEEIAEYTGWEYEYVYDSWENHLESLKNGEIDFICHAQKTDEREENYLFSKYAIGAESSILYVREDDNRYYYNDFEAFDGMRIAVLTDSFQNAEFSEYAAKKGFDFEFVNYDTPEKCFEALDAKEVDAAALGSLSLKPGYKVICRFGSDPFYFMTGLKNEDLMDELDDALGQITAAGSSFQTDLYQKYYGNMVADQEVIMTREEAEYIEEADAIKIAFIPSLKPFSYMNDEDEITGITVDILKLLEEKSGLTFEYEMMPNGVKPSDYLEENPEAFVAGIMVDNPAFANEDYLLTDCYYTDDVALVCLSGMDFDLDAKDCTYKLAIPGSYVALENHIKENYPQFEIILCEDTEACLEMVQEEKVDFAAQNVNVLEPYLANPHYEGMTVVPTFFMQENMGIVSLNTDENQIVTNILNRCISSITSTELAQFTVDHTVANSYRLTVGDMLYRFRYPFVAIGVLAFAVIILLIAFSILRRRNYHRLEEKNKQLGEAVAQANEANRAKSQFLARMSHEIRTPMNAIVGLTELAKHKVEEPGQVGEYLNKIETSSKVLLNIINDVLDMSAIESDKMKIAQSSFVLRDILDSIETVYATQCKQKGVSFELDTKEVTDYHVWGDGLRLNQILLNLISNAYKFTPEGGKITVTVREVQRREDNAYYQFIVTDTGEGMGPEMLERLFQPFEQEGAETAQKHGGSGLGLSIAKNLVELMGGSISCQSEKGCGTTFTVSLPFGLEIVSENDEVAMTKKVESVEVADAAVDKAVSADKTETVDETGTVDAIETVDETGTAKRLESANETEGLEQKDYDFHGKKVLLVEDTELNAEIARELLSLVNMKVDHVWNGKEAVEMFEAAAEGTYEAVLMDIQMPVMNGYEASEAIRGLKHPEAATIPIYAMTANAFTEDVSASLNAGMNGHIAKPIDTAILYQTLDKVVKEKECRNI